jgi:hypothetical protein
MKLDNQTQTTQVQKVNYKTIAQVSQYITATVSRILGFRIRVPKDLDLMEAPMSSPWSTCKSRSLHGHLCGR